MKSVAIIGYYGFHNLGDDMFKEVFQRILPSFQITFVSMREEKLTGKYDAIILGAGDVVNRWFMEKFKCIVSDTNTPKYLVGAGIPYEEYIVNGSMDIFSHAFIRTKSRMKMLTMVYGTRQVHFCPDLGFALTPSPRLKTDKKRIGIFPVGDKLFPIPQALIGFAKWAVTNGYELIAIVFDTKTKSDSMCCNELKRLVPSVIIKGSCRKGLTTREVLDEMASMDAAICMRFHSHIFCTIQGVPFISINKTQKVRDFLSQIDWKYMVNDESTMDSYISSFKRIVSTPSLSTHLRRMYRTFHETVSTLKINNILLHGTTMPLRRNHMFTVDTKSIIEKVEKVNKMTQECAKELAEDICFEITNMSNSKYVFGMTKNLLAGQYEIGKMVKWLIEDNIRSQCDSLDMSYINQNAFKGVHRAGWQYVTDRLKSLTCNCPNIICDTYMDGTFLWSSSVMERKGIIPYMNYWIGFAHHTSLEEYSKNNSAEIFKNKSFLISLNMCKGIFCLTEYLAKWYRTMITKAGFNVPVYSVFHPTLFVDRTFVSLGKHRLVNIGAWYRNPWAIHTINAPPGWRKQALEGRKMQNYFKPPNLKFTVTDCLSLNSENKWVYYMFKWMKVHMFGQPLKTQLGDGKSKKIKCKESVIDIDGETTTHDVLSLRNTLVEMIDSVSHLSQLSNEEYDKLFTEAVIFVHFEDASAANTIIESIVRNTPIVTNRIPPVVEYLGADYPLLYDSVDEVSGMLNDDNVTKAHKYLRAKNKDNLRIDTFLEKMSVFLKNNK